MSLTDGRLRVAPMAINERVVGVHLPTMTVFDLATGRFIGFTNTTCTQISHL